MNLRLISVGVCCVALIPIVGCLRVAPRIPAALASPASITYSVHDFDTDVANYRQSVLAGMLDAAKTQRNSIIFRILAQVDAAYGEFEIKVSTRRAGYQTSGDAAQLGLTAAATVVGASGIKDILSATATALQGTRLSFDKNFFEQQTTEALVSQMRAARKTLQAQILLSLSTRDVNNYPVEAAWVDVVDYYYAGTIPSALVDIASKAGSDAVKADQNLQTTVAKLTGQAISVRTEYQQLSQQVTSTDSTVVQHATDVLRKILTADQISFDPGASPAVLLDTLRKAMSDAVDNDVKLEKLNSAVQSVLQQ